MRASTVFVLVTLFEGTLKNPLAAAVLIAHFTAAMSLPLSRGAKVVRPNSLEPLESRFCPSGVAIAHQHRDLIISGDASDGLDIVQINAKTVRITEGGELLGNFRVPRGLLFDLGDGNDSVHLHLIAAGLPNRLIADLGEGDNVFSVDSVGASHVRGVLKVTTGAGLDVISLGSADYGLQVTGNLQVATGAGADEVTLQRVNLARIASLISVNSATIDNTQLRQLSIDTRDEANSNSWSLDATSRVLGKVTVFGGGGNDTLHLSARVGDSLYVALGNGVNSLEVQPTTISGAVTYDGGTDADRVTLNGAVTVGDLRVNMGGGDNEFTSYAGLDLRRSISLIGADGADHVIVGGTVRGSMTIALGGGSNSAELAGSMGGLSLNYFGGAGTDSVDFAEVALRASVRIDTGAGDDEFMVRSNAYGTAAFNGGDGADKLTAFVSMASTVFTTSQIETTVQSV